LRKSTLKPLGASWTSPFQELKAFKKTKPLKPGESERIDTHN
jgi:hypothetical protein